MGTVGININIDREVWRRFKAVCAIKGASARDTVEAMVKSQVQECGKLLDKLEGIVGVPVVTDKGSKQLDIEDDPANRSHCLGKTHADIETEDCGVIGCQDEDISPDNIESELPI